MLIYMLNYEISCQELKELLDAGAGSGFVLLDVREPWEQDTALIEGSRSMPMGDVPSRANQELDPESHVVTVCHHGVRSMSVAMWLREQGFEKAQSLCGGIDGWSAVIDPSVPRY
jgi:rhodanese-related sulfurtransferase